MKEEGLLSLTRGFMYAGAARVVVSLWSVDDKATAELMEKVYRRMLVGGDRPAAALRAAQVEMAREEMGSAVMISRRRENEFWGKGQRPSHFISEQTSPDWNGRRSACLVRSRSSQHHNRH
ncbi:MAG: CHAT domain-containing protein [Blastocatellia bacterium]|nr:CHAT domain-containing protein [Blastocatellia bacterium]